METEQSGLDQTGSCRGQGEWLASHRWEMDRGESSWLWALARFDRDQGWALDGQLSATDWLIWRTKMARATAYEKLCIAHQLTIRPVIADAFAAGRISYSAVRVITRIDRPDPAVDAALVDLAEAGTVTDVERAGRHYPALDDQERRPPDPFIARALRIIRHGDGTGRIEGTLTDLEIDEFAATLQAFLDLSAGLPNQSPAGDTQPGGTDTFGTDTAGTDVAGTDAAGGGVSDGLGPAGQGAGPSPRGDTWGMGARRHTQGRRRMAAAPGRRLCRHDPHRPRPWP